MKPTVLVGTIDGLHQLGDRPRIELPRHEVRSLIQDGSRWWAVVDMRAAWRRGDDHRWQEMASVPDGSNAICALATPQGVLVGTSGPHLSRLRDGTLEWIASFDQVRGRNSWFNPGGREPDVRSMSTDRSGTFYVNVHVGGILRSRDSLKSWEPTIEVAADVHQVLFDPGSGLLLAASQQGLGVSEDQGESWRFDTEGLHGAYLRAVAVARETVLVTASTGPFTNHAAIYRKPVTSKGRFERCTQGLPDRFRENINTFNLAVSNSRVVFGTAEGSVYYSENEGGNWEPLAEDLPTPRCLVFADEAQPGLALA